MALSSHAAKYSTLSVVLRGVEKAEGIAAAHIDAARRVLEEKRLAVNDDSVLRMAQIIATIWAPPDGSD